MPQTGRGRPAACIGETGQHRRTEPDGASPLRPDDTRPALTTPLSRDANANMPTAPLQPGGSRCGSQTLSERLEKSWEPVERNRLCRIVDIGT